MAWIAMPASDYQLATDGAMASTSTLYSSIDDYGRGKLRMTCHAVNILQSARACFCDGRDGNPLIFEREVAALVLVMIHTVQSYPESAFGDNELVDYLSTTAGCMIMPESLFALVLPSDVPLGLERIFSLAEKQLEKAQATARPMNARGPRMKHRAKEYVNSYVEQKDTVKKLIDEAKSASETDTARAVRRAEVLAVLPCAFVGCSIFASPEGKNYRMCSGCKIVRYCCAQCQKNDWKVHKVACKAAAVSGGKK
jgi:hypothetical protein